MLKGPGENTGAIMYTTNLGNYTILYRCPLCFANTIEQEIFVGFNFHGWSISIISLV